MLCCRVYYAEIKQFDVMSPTPYAQYDISHVTILFIRSLLWLRLDILFIQNRFSLLLISSSKSELAFTQ